MTKSNKKKNITFTKRNPLIIEYTTSLDRNKKSNTKKNNKRKITKKKKMLIIESSSSCKSTPPLQPITSLQKINDIFLPIKKGDKLKSDLKITQDLSKMSERLNEKFIEIMEKLANIMLKQGEPFRSRAYQKAQETIIAYSDDILSPNDLKGKPGIGTTIIEKLNEYVETGTLQILEKEKNNPVNIFTEVYGIGPKKAKELADQDIVSISQLRENQQLLNDIQKVGLYYYEDILERIPRSEIEEYKTIFENTFPKGADGKMEIVGSYRRGAESSGDIDVIITSNNPNIFVKFIDNLIKDKIILNVLSRGPTKCLVITKIQNSFNKARRVDFLYTTSSEFPFAILYFTGSKIFNTVMRHVALDKGYTMNEHGIYKMEAKKKGEKVNKIFTSEDDIFNFLGLEYKAPNERTDGRAIVIIKDSKSYKNIYDNFKKDGISVLEQLSEKELSELLREANKAYYNEEPFLTDNQYDIIKEYIEIKYPTNTAVHEIGAQVDRNKVTLPYPMGSMDKIKPDTNALSNWNAKYRGPYALSCKLDGVSGLYTTEGNKPSLYTRGDGKVGQDISHLIPFLRLPKIKGIVIRGEFIISKNLFQAKYKDKFANPRNMVAGIVNQKTINETIKDLHFVAYEVIKPILKPYEQMTYLETLDVECVSYKIESSISNDLLSQILVDWRYNYVYEIDGVIVTNDAIYDRKVGNPEHAFAFKMVLSDQVTEAKVVDVLWAPSKDGYLKPRVQIEPINLGGVQITYATGFNGSFINDNKIGIGAVVELIRSGDVIPYIRKVIIPANEAKMPLVSFKWNDTHVDIVIEDIDSDEIVREKNITGFFRGIGVEGLSTGNVKRIIEVGFNTISDIIKMSINDFLKVEGFKEKTATKIYDGIKDKINTASLVTIMSASNIFGRGFSEKRIELIMESYPKVLLSTETDLQKIDKISLIKGMAVKSAQSFVEKIPNFIQFMKDARLVTKLVELIPEKKLVNESNLLFGKSIIMTGFRDNELQEVLKNMGAKVGSSISSKTFVVLVKDKGEDTVKASEAKKLGVPLMTRQEFTSKYL
jgi:DNA ligase (NAD+)